jgi:hypothetical protein
MKFKANNVFWFVMCHCSELTRCSSQIAHTNHITIYVCTGSLKAVSSTPKEMLSQEQPFKI